MAAESLLCLGLDVGSVSVNLVVMNGAGEILAESYTRHKGQPMRMAAAQLAKAVRQHGEANIAGLAATGAGGRIVTDILGGTFVNEVVAQATSTGRLYPHVNTVVEIGGEDSKLVSLAHSDDGRVAVADFAMNTMCAAGTGSFLDQQASRLGLSIEAFGEMALQSAAPPRVAGRCSVFAKSDMIHLQQKATPLHDIVAGLCLALVRNFKSTVGSVAPFVLPISFHGGVAANPGIARALRKVLEVEHDQLQIPEHFAAMGAIGAVLNAQATGLKKPDLSRIRALAAYASIRAESLPPLKLERSVVSEGQVRRPARAGGIIPAYLGVDVGSISTNILVMDARGVVLSKRYLMTAGRPIEAVRQGLTEVAEEVGALVDIRGACTTGSGRYLIADVIGADEVRNEITAQARGALALDPTVDTIFEIGGQDAKFIRLENGAVRDFEMNKVCAAGTGSFLEEQAEKLGIPIQDAFAALALRAQHPINLGERCTVFMETELQKNQQAGAAVEDLVAGLAYAFVYNYLNRVVAPHQIGDRIFFQGGTAFNHAIVAAFEQVLGKPITVPPHHEVTGALGCALIAHECDEGHGSRFKGFDLAKKHYEISSLECPDCPNHCEINAVTIAGEPPLYYGSRCEKYDVQRRASPQANKAPNLFAEREKFLLNSYTASTLLPVDAPKVGVPRAGMVHDLFPFWHALLTELGLQVVLSDCTNTQIIHEGAAASVAETCFPVKVNLGHVLNLLKKRVDYIWLPSVINLPTTNAALTDSYACPYIQSLAYMFKSSVDFEGAGVEVLQPVIYLALGRRHRITALTPLAKKFGKSTRDLARALDVAEAAQATFLQHCQERGAELLAHLPPDQRAIVLVGRSYSTCDPGASLDLPRKLHNMGVLAIPLDFLPLDDIPLPADWFNMYWHSGQRILAAAEVIAHDRRLNAIYLTNFGCGPDSFVTRFFSERLGHKPALIIEVDEHSADVGVITRCEAYLDSLAANMTRHFAPGRRFRPLNITKGNKRTVLIPNMSGHAYGMAAAFEACGMPARPLPEPDEETLFWGRQFTTGKECFPCIVTTGDMVKFTKSPQFERDKYAFFMGGSGGPCRFGQYNALQRMILDDLGYEDVPIYAPNQASNFYNEIGLVGRKFLRLGWDGLVAVDLLEKALLQTRPYEVVAGSARTAYLAARDDVCAAITNGARVGPICAALRRSRARFDDVTVARGTLRPVIGLVGEFYIRASAFSNQNIIAQIEALGGEVWMAPVYEWFLYRNFRRDMRARLAHRPLLRVKNALMDRVMKSDERTFVAAFNGQLRNAHEPSTEQVLDYAAPYLHHSFEGEAIMTVGKAIDFARKGLAGIVAVMPFTCMPGTISNAIMKRVRHDENEIPFLNMVYDGLEQATALTRLEAFMHQAREYAGRNGAVRVH